MLDVDNVLPWRMRPAVAQEVERALGRETRFVVLRAGDVRRRTQCDAVCALEGRERYRVDVTLRGRRVRRLGIPAPRAYELQWSDLS